MVHGRVEDPDLVDELALVVTSVLLDELAVPRLAFSDADRLTRCGIRISAFLYAASGTL